MRIPPQKLFNRVRWNNLLLPLPCFVIMFHTEYSQLFSFLNGMPHTRLVLDGTACCSLLPPTPLIHWLVDWEASLAIWENNVISGWAELLNPLWDYSLLSASVITDHRQKKETKVFPLLYASIFILTSSVWRELFSIGFENWHSPYYFPSTFSLLAAWQCLKVQEHTFCSLLHWAEINTFVSNIEVNAERYKNASAWSELC